MLTLRRSEERGHADHGWLDAHHTFSFAGFHDPQWVHFGPLRVLNQDRVAGGGGFPPHPHEDMEIVTYVLEGALEHKDSMGNGSVIRPGEVQVMSAGTGVVHSEVNPSRTEPVHLLQMWVFPRHKGGTPRYDQRSFRGQLDGGLLRVVAPDGTPDSMTIDQDASLYVGRLTEGRSARHAVEPGRAVWVHLARGRLRVNDQELGPGDGLGATAGEALELTGLAGDDAAELVLWDLPELARPKA